MGGGTAQGGASKKFARSQHHYSLTGGCEGREPQVGSASRLLHLQEPSTVGVQPRAAAGPRQETLEPR